MQDVTGPVGVVGACLYNGASGPFGDGAWVEVRKGLDAVRGGKAEVVMLKEALNERPRADFDLIGGKV